MVADLIHTEKRFETAIETALGGSIQNIVTDTDQTAKRLIAFLKQNKFGRATFLPLNGISTGGDFRQKAVLDEPGIIGLASSLVSADEAYGGLVTHLLGRVVVADTIDDAMRVARKYHYGVRIVTLEGELLNTGGSMTGGAFKNSSNLLGRNREIQELEKRADAAGKNWEKARKALEKEDARIQKLTAQAEELAGQLQASRIARTEAQMNRKQAETRIEEVIRDRAEFVQETAAVEEKIRNIREEETALEESIQAIDQENRQAEDSIREYGEALGKEQETRDALAKKAEEMGLALANLTQAEQFTRENQERIGRETEKLKQEQQELMAQKDASRDVIAQRMQEIDAVREIIKELEQQAADLSREGEELARRREEKQASQKVFFRQMEECARQDAALDKELFRLTSQKEKQEETLDARTQYLWAEYEMSPSEAQAMRQEEYTDLSSLKRQAGELKNQIRALGSVNVNAIEAYQELEQRYTFMKSQHDDLAAAEASLVQVIEELDVGMRRQFEEKFEDIRREFDKVFKELFGGGKGTLELTEGEDIIEAGFALFPSRRGKNCRI